MKKLLTSAAVAAALSLIGASSADAAKYFLTVADPGAGLTGSPYGEVDVLGDGTSSLDITVMLYGTNEFHWTNDVNHHALAFDLVGNPTITISGLASNFSAGDGLRSRDLRLDRAVRTARLLYTRRYGVVPPAEFESASPP